MSGTSRLECPSEFALDDREIHDGGALVAEGHDAACPRCAARQAGRAAAQIIFDGQASALWTRIAAGGRQREPRRQRLLGLRWPVLAAGLAAIGVLGLWAVPRLTDRGGPTYVAAKGRAPVEIICRRAGDVFALAPDDQVEPGDELRFRPLPIWLDARFIQLGSVDGTGRYTPFYPASAGERSLPLPPSGVPLEGSIRLDAAPGPERIFVVLSTAPLPVAIVATAAETHARTVAPVERLGDASVMSAWIVLPKRAGGPAAP